MSVKRRFEHVSDKSWPLIGLGLCTSAMLIIWVVVKAIANAVPDGVGVTALAVIFASTFYVVALLTGLLIAPALECLGWRKYLSDFLFMARPASGLINTQGTITYELHLGSDSDFVLHCIGTSGCSSDGVKRDMLDGLIELAARIRNDEKLQTARFEATSHVMIQDLAAILYLQTERGRLTHTVRMLAGYPLIKFRSRFTGAQVSLRKVMKNSRSARFTGVQLLHHADRLHNFRTGLETGHIES